ncbi:hypothetical protein SYJ56_22215 [Algoriphagus sp. D3-2-R+10]|uniref:hypothetical protein n=1 Tax=Algoriphagus aurantiacus TaxID=3103948 RepID=UPI002B3787F4|nr:hypothetical protein [Algoriphagus sp. D3-2-R+10]MEB2778044.1 hypothetical protein [Algoriphagus sp. D3-2-R+10]
MNGKPADDKYWTDPKDYGLPYVKVVPLAQAGAPKKEEEKIVPIDVAEVKKRTIQAAKPTVVGAEKVASAKPQSEAKKSSNSWIWIAAILALAVISVIIWQMNKSVVPASGKVVALEDLSSEEKDEITINSTPSEETQMPDNQKFISDSLSSVSTTPESAQTGTTIASTESGTLVRVTEKADRPQFYIIVGSLPNEAMALKEAEQYKNRAETIYLILPYEDATNYRLAIGTSRGWTAINEELARVKDQYTEDLWILKY